MIGGLLKRLFGGGPANGGGSGKSRQELNDMVRAQLEGMGDNGHSPRHVRHFVYPIKGSDSVSRDQIAVHLAELSFDVINDAASDDGFVMEQTREVASADFDAFTTQMSDDLRVKGWEYDGWECAVITEE